MTKNYLFILKVIILGISVFGLLAFLRIPSSFAAYVCWGSCGYTQPCPVPDDVGCQEPKFCWNGPSTTDSGGCGTSCNGGNPWIKYESTQCVSVDQFTCGVWTVQSSNTCSTGDKYKSSNQPVMDQGLCSSTAGSCDVGSPYKTCCNGSTPVNANHYQTDIYAPDEADCGSYSTVQCFGYLNQQYGITCLSYYGINDGDTIPGTNQKCTNAFCGTSACQAAFPTPTPIPIPIPQAPINLQNPQVCQADNSVTANLSWNPPATGSTPTGYKVYKWTGSAWQFLSDRGNTTSYTWVGLVQGNGYTWGVTAYNSAGESDPVSAYQGFTAMTCPPPPPDNPTTDTCIVREGTPTRISWNRPTGATSFQVRIDDTTANGWNGLCNGSQNTGDICFDNYVNSNNPVTYDVTITPGHNYKWWVHACGSGGCSAQSSDVTFQGAYPAKSSSCLVPPPLPGSGPPPEKYGDVDGDLYISCLDAEKILDKVAGFFNPGDAQIEKADVSDTVSGRQSVSADVNSTDAQEVGQYLSAGIPLPVCGGPPPAVCTDPDHTPVGTCDGNVPPQYCPNVTPPAIPGNTVPNCDGSKGTPSCPCPAGQVCKTDGTGICGTPTPTPTPAPGTVTIQGHFVDQNGVDLGSNIGQAVYIANPPTSYPVTYNSTPAWRQVFWNNSLPPANGYNVTAGSVAGYSISYSLCNSCINHPIPYTSGQAVTVNLPIAGNYADIYFKYTPTAATPTPTPTPAPSCSISGTIYIDTNENGIKDSGESGYNYGGSSAGNIKLAYCFGGCGPIGPTNFTADVNGKYSASGLSGDGGYDVTIYTPAGYFGTTPNPKRSPEIICPQNATVDFGIAPTHTISGNVFIDNGAGGGIANNGVKDGTEANYTASTPTIKLDTTNPTSNSGGAYTFSGLAGNSSYGITLTAPNGYAISNGGVNPNTNPRYVTVTTSNVVGVNFGIVGPQSISGNVYIDSNDNGIKDAGESNYPGATLSKSNPDENLGYTVISSGTTGTANRIRLSRITVPSTKSGVVSQGRMYIQGSTNDAIVYMVVYDDVSLLPKNLIAVSNGVLVRVAPFAGWVNFTFPSSFSIAANQNIWIGIYADIIGTTTAGSNGPLQFYSGSVAGDFASDGYVRVDWGDAPVPSDLTGLRFDSSTQLSPSAYLIVPQPPTSFTSLSTSPGYTFTNLAPFSSYDFQLTPPPGYIISYGGLNPNTNPRSVNVQGSPVNNVDFGIKASAGNYTISGQAVIDNPPYGTYEPAGDPNLSWSYTVSYSNSNGTIFGSRTSSAGGAYPSGSDISVPAGTYSVSYTSSPPSGYITSFPSTLTHVVTVGPSCDEGASSAYGALCDATGNITGLNFGFKLPGSWIQTGGTDIRNDSGGFDNIIPNTAAIPPASAGACTAPFGNAYTSVYGTGGSPGIVFSGNTPAEFGAGSASAPPANWKVGSSTYPDFFTPSKGIYTTSYAYVSGRVKQSGITPTIITSATCGAGGLTGCALSSMSSGVYTVDPTSVGGTFTINSFSGSSIFPAAASKRIIILVNGNLLIKSPITVPLNSRSTLTFIVSRDIHIDKSVGVAWNSAATQVEGFYSADGGFIIDGEPTACSPADIRLNMAGSVIVNAGRNTPAGQFINNRTLCTNNATCPVFTITERPDFVLNAPESIKQIKTIYQEVAP